MPIEPDDIFYVPKPDLPDLRTKNEEESRLRIRRQPVEAGVYFMALKKGEPQFDYDFYMKFLLRDTKHVNFIQVVTPILNDYFYPDPDVEDYSPKTMSAGYFRNELNRYLFAINMFHGSMGGLVQKSVRPMYDNPKHPLTQVGVVIAHEHENYFPGYDVTDVQKFSTTVIPRIYLEQGNTILLLERDDEYLRGTGEPDSHFKVSVNTQQFHFIQQGTMSGNLVIQGLVDYNSLGEITQDTHLEVRKKLMERDANVLSAVTARFLQYPFPFSTFADRSQNLYPQIANRLHSDHGITVKIFVPQARFTNK